MTNLEALKKLYVQLGGEASDVADMTTSAEVIEALSTIAASAGIELPKVTSSDNGDVLTVVEGKWNKASLPAPELPDVTAEDDGDVLTVTNGAWGKATPTAPAREKFHVIYTVDSEGEASCDKTLEEICEAYEAGKTILAEFTSANSAYRDYSTGEILLQTYWNGDDRPSIRYVCTSQFLTNVSYLQIDHYMTDSLEETVEIYAGQITISPAGN